MQMINLEWNIYTLEKWDNPKFTIQSSWKYNEVLLTKLILIFAYLIGLVQSTPLIQLEEILNFRNSATCMIKEIEHELPSSQLQFESNTMLCL